MPPENNVIRAELASLADYTRPELIIPSLRQRDLAGVIGELTQLLQQRGCVPDALPFYHAALNQEFLSSTPTGCGIALPHARCAGVKALQFALGRSDAPIPWKAKEAHPVRLIFLIAIPPTEAICYLQLLSRLAKLTGEPDVVARLRSAGTGAEIQATLRSCTFSANAA